MCLRGCLLKALAAVSSASRFGAFLSGVEDFDVEAFGISSAEALAMDPQHRLLLASTAELLATSAAEAEPVLSSSSYATSPDSAAAARKKRVKEDTGVFIGISWAEYHQLGRLLGQHVGASTAQGAVLSVACGRCECPCRCAGHEVEHCAASRAAAYMLVMHSSCTVRDQGPCDRSGVCWQVPAFAGALLCSSSLLHLAAGCPTTLVSKVPASALTPPAHRLWWPRPWHGLQ